ncbi:MAG TPA: response regulator [Ignavibacteriales bacterium]|nr:response regulator [Ignavibacteriales bacterium]
MANIVVVEDDPHTRKNIVQILERSGYKAQPAENGCDALEILSRKTPDLIISDIMMPGMDGYELCRRVNSDSEEVAVPFIFLTGKTEYTDFRKGMLTGAEDYITKPFDARDLLKSVELRLKKIEKCEKKVDAFKNNILHNISHEFRTPLVPIIGYAQMLKENSANFDPQEILKMAEKISSSGSWMLKLIEKFLLLLELEEETGSKKKGFASSEEVIKKCAAQAASAAERKNDFSLSLTGDILQVPEMDLERILNELLENACRFSEPGTPIEVVSLSGDKFHLISITDHGIGMMPEEIKNIASFSQFSRLGMHHAGLGLGLTIVKKLTLRNNIKFNIESLAGLFTRVTLEIPLCIKS